MNDNKDNSDLKDIIGSFEKPKISLIVPTTKSQLEIWLSCKIGGADANCSYNQFTALRLAGSFDKEAMLAALQCLVEKHQSLRMTFSTDGKNIHVHNNVKLHVDYRDLSSQTADQQHSFLKEFNKQIALTALDLESGPLFKATLFKFDEQEHYLVLIAHHIICDGWSMGIVSQDLASIYSAFAKKETVASTDALLFSDYARELTEFEEGPFYAENELYWLEQFEGSPHFLNLPSDYVRPALRTYESQKDDFTLEGQLITELKTLAKSAGCSYPIVLIAAFEFFLHQVTGQEEIILGLPAAGQPATDSFRLVGHCVNLLALRSRPKGNISFKDYLKQRRAAVLDAYDHQLYAFGNLLNKLHIPRDPSRPPLVQVVLNIESGLDEDVDFYGLEHTFTPNPKQFENFEIFLQVDNLEDSLVLKWVYNTRLFKSSTINQMMDEFEYLLQQLVKGPETLLGNIPRLNAEKLSAQLAKWNNTTFTYPRQTALHSLITDRAIAIPDKTAITFGSQKTSYKLLNEQSNQFAAILIENGVCKGDKVALATDRSAEMMVALLAIMKAGAVYIPLDPQFPINRINYMLEDSKAAVLLTSKKYQNKFGSNAKELLIEDLWLNLRSYPSSEPAVAVNGDDLVYILYTSGSTGMPKGVQIAHHNLVNFLTSMQAEPGLKAEDKLLAVTTISFDIAGLELFLPLLTGAEIVIADTASTKDGRELLNIIKREQVTVMQATPYSWRILIEAGWDKTIPLKVICGGEALPVELANELLERTTSLWNVYGPTETTIWSTIKRLTSEEKIISIGRPINNTSIYILDEFLNPLAPGIAGEIYIGGDGVAKGYLNRPELTAEKFVDDPFSKLAGQKMYRTGDLGKFMHNGEIECLGRIDAQVKIRGYRIETGEIEFQLAAEADIKEAIVIARPDKLGMDKLVAFIVAAGNEPVVSTAASVQRWKDGLKNSVPDYMVPDNFVIIPELPLTPNGKIDKKSLAKYKLSEEDTEADNYVAPATPIEKLIAGIWTENFGIEKISVHDDFFEIGGHSLMALKIVALLEKETSKSLPVSILFEYPTIKKLANFLKKDEIKSKAKSLVQIKATGKNKPLYVVSGLNGTAFAFVEFAKMFDAEQPVFLLQEPQEIDDMSEFPDNVEGIAAIYIEELLRQNPDGPYALAGHCFGGIIAFEMARQMEKIGKEVKLLALIDASVGKAEKLRSGVKKNPYLFKNGIQDVFFKLYKNINLLRIDRKLALKYRKESLDRFANRLKKIASPNNTAEKYSFPVEITQRYETAKMNYLVTPYDRDVVLFKAKLTSFRYADKKYYDGNQM